jgi:CHAT domain-containing protein
LGADSGNGNAGVNYPGRSVAGAFIGSLWEVVDTLASTYAQEFYRAALAGHTLGESARQARDAIRDNPGDPTWLAYTLYGDPAATTSCQP